MWRHKTVLVLGAAGLVLAMPQTGAAQDSSALFGKPQAFTGKKLKKLIAEAQAYPLGSARNPVRAEMPQGQRAYLARLRCSDGERPQFERIGSYGFGAYGQIVDGYRVVCDGSDPAEVTIIMDMYHPGHQENQAVPEFTIVGG